MSICVTNEGSCFGNPKLSHRFEESPLFVGQRLALAPEHGRATGREIGSWQNGLPSLFLYEVDKRDGFRPYHAPLGESRCSAPSNEIGPHKRACISVLTECRVDRIFRARRLSISAWRGAGAFAPVAVFEKSE